MDPYEYTKDLDFYLSDDLKDSESREDLESRIEKYFSWNSAGVQLFKSEEDAIAFIKKIAEEEEWSDDLEREIDEVYWGEFPFETVFFKEISIRDGDDEWCDKYLVRVYQSEIDGDACYYHIMEV